MENTDFIYGKNAIIEALTSGKREINKILISKNIHTDTKIEKIKELASGQLKDEANAWFVGEPFKVFYDYKKEGIWQLGITYQIH